MKSESEAGVPEMKLQKRFFLCLAVFGFPHRDRDILYIGIAYCHCHVRMYVRFLKLENYYAGIISAFCI